MNRFMVLAAGLAFASAPALGQASNTLEGVFTVGAATPLGAWADQSQGSLQVGIGGRYHFSAVLLGGELLLVEGHSKRQFSSAEDGNLTTVGLVPQVFVPIITGQHWQFLGMAGYGVARVSATSGYRTDLVPTSDGTQVSTYGGSTTWHTIRPMEMVGLGLIRSNGSGKRIGLEARWQQVATPGLRATSLSACLLVAW